MIELVTISLCILMVIVIALIVALRWGVQDLINQQKQTQAYVVYLQTLLRSYQLKQEHGLENINWEG